MKKIVLAVVVIAVLAAVALFGYRAHLIDELRKPVLAQLNDPDSAQFRNERAIGDWTLDGTVLCGEVNTKNRMGGYVGYTPYEAGKSSASIIRAGSIVPACDFEKELLDSAKWWWLRW